MGNPASFYQKFAKSPVRRFLVAAIFAYELGVSLLAQVPTTAEIEQIRLQAEQQGDPDAQNSLGNAYTNGAGVPQDFAKALEWYRRSAEKGFVQAQFNLGLLYEMGRGVDVDQRQAFKYYLQAAEQGFGPAQFNVGNMYATGRGIGQDFFEANLWYKQAAEKGIPQAQYNLGLAYETGRGVRKDEAQAARWYKQAADRGYAGAQYNLGLLFETGRGVPANEATAAALYRAAADQGLALAQNNLGVMMAAGRGGFAADPVQAYVWLSRAVKNGAKPDARDFLAKSMRAEQLAAADRMLAAPSPQAALVAAPVSAPARPAPSTVKVAEVPTVANAQVEELTAALVKARQANSEYAELNQRLELEKARLEQELAAEGDNPKLIEQLREQSRRLAAKVEDLTSDKAVAERQMAVLAAQVKDYEQNLTKAPAPVTSAPADDGKWREQIASLTAKLTAAQEEFKQLKIANEQLAAANDRLTKEKETLAETVKNRPAPTALPAAQASVTGSNPDGVVANLQRDNARLNDEVKRATIELLALNQKIRSLQNQLSSAKPTTGPEGAATDGIVAQVTEQLSEARREIARLNNTISELRAAQAASDKSAAQIVAFQAKLETAAREVANLQSENQTLAAQVATLQATPKPAPVDGDIARQLTEAREARQQLQARLDAMQTEQAAAEQKRQALEQTVQEQTVLLQQAESRQTTVREELRATKQQLATLVADGEQGRQKSQEENRQLKTQIAGLQAQLAARPEIPDTSAEVADLKKRLGAAQARADQLAAEGGQLASQATEGRNALREAQAQVKELVQQVQQADGEISALRAKQAAQLASDEKLSAEVATLRQERALAETRLDGLTKQLTQEQANKARGSDETKKLETDLAEANQALAKLQSTVAELTTENQRLDKAVTDGAKRSEQLVGLTTEVTQLRTQNAALTQGRDRLAGLQAENNRLEALVADGQKERDRGLAKVGELEKLLEEARTIRTRGGDDIRKAQTELAEANRSIEALNATVAELTAANDRLEKDLESARKSTAAALAAQSQAVSAAQPDAYKMEISTLQARVKELETQNEVERGHAAQEVATLADQLARVRETNRSLTDANRALLSAKQAEIPTVSKDDYDQLQAKVRDLMAAAGEMRHQQQALTDERDELKQQLTDARKVATVLPGLSEEKAALEERLEAVGAQLIKAQQEIDTLQKENAEAASRAMAGKASSEQLQAQLAELQGRAGEAEKAAQAHNSSVAELTELNTKLESERNDLRKQLAALRTDNTRLSQTATNIEQLKAEADRSAQQNIDTLAAQLAQARRELQSARDANSRLVEGNVSQERERTATIAQLRQENTALQARLTQAQGTLDQIASAARLGTPAAALASGVPVAGRAISGAPTASEATGRSHTVIEGDSLSRISMRYYGTPNRWQEIFQANREQLQGSSALRIGMQLRIP